MARRSFTTEFKHEAASLVVDQKYTVRQASEAVGVAESEIRRWVKQLRLERSGGTPAGSKALTPEQQEIQKLKKQVAQLERDKAILKKATALLMSDSHDQFR
ncbi:IS3 family transposase [Allohahella marinimesophila]|uniref:IS3 family transposase n=1 Tax=Allohahella marinimesophila TaxID=1054972 RepID=A0ABP7NIV1_9GAMM